MSTSDRIAVQAPGVTRPQRSGTLWPTLRAIYIIWYRDILRFWRDRMRLIGSLAQPLLFLIVFGTGLSSALSGAGGGFNGGLGGAAGSDFGYTQFIFPGIIGMSILFSAIFGAMSIVWDREFGFLKEVLVAPIDRSAVAIGKALGGATQAMIQGLILLVLSPIVGVKLTVVSVLLVILFSFLLAFSLSALGVLIASRMKSMQGFQVVMNFLMMPIFFLSGSLFPLQGLPDWMTFLTRIDPASYGMDPLRRVMLEGAGLPAAALDRLSLTIGDYVLPIWLEGLILLAFGLVVLAFAVVNFRRRD
jgi:ABC-2 type transport system permease protein